MATVLFVVKATIRKDQEEAFNRWSYRRLMASEHMKALRADYDARFGAASERARFAYTQVWP